ncbi:aromatic prenyltransferase [Aspergillus pseudoustus]|uniref:Aromatic prenyltransferase n=1 Tax=Aspergillus pseudoustus TaxID=1810923 RepID=A0ABR4JPU9_9EURO
MTATPDESNAREIIPLQNGSDLKEKRNASSPYYTLSTYLSFPTREQEQWWSKTGPVLGRMLEASGYALDQQFQYLTLHYNQIVPRLGPYPPKLQSNLTVSGLLIEFSINYQQKGTTHPTVRLGIEPTDSFSGTERDPFNKVPLPAALNEFERMSVKGFDSQLYTYFEPKHALTREEQLRVATEIPGGGKRTTQGAMAFNLDPRGINMKGYTFPGIKAHLAHVEVKSMITEAIGELKTQGKGDWVEAWAKTADYVTETNGWGFHNLWGWDYVDPSLSRFKFYTWQFDVPDMTKLSELFTLNNRAVSPTHLEGLTYLHKLWDIINLKGSGKRELPADASQPPENTNPMLLSYEIKSGNPLPYAKVYFPLQGFNDLACVQKIARFWEFLGWKELAESYPATVQSFFPNHDLSKTTHLVYWISFSYSEKQGVYSSVYYHANPVI